MRTLTIHTTSYSLSPLSQAWAGSCVFNPKSDREIKNRKLREIVCFM